MKLIFLKFKQSSKHCNSVNHRLWPLDWRVVILATGKSLKSVCPPLQTLIYYNLFSKLSCFCCGIWFGIIFCKTRPHWASVNRSAVILHITHKKSSKSENIYIFFHLTQFFSVTWYFKKTHAFHSVMNKTRGSWSAAQLNQNLKNERKQDFDILLLIQDTCSSKE